MAAKRKIDLDELLAQIAELPPEQQRELLQKARCHLRDVNIKPIEASGVWDEIVALSSTISEEDATLLPKDGSIYYKHYLYGHPKND